MFTVCQRVCDEYGYALVCVDNRNAGKSTQEARKYQTDMLRKRIFPNPQRSSRRQHDKPRGCDSGDARRRGWSLAPKFLSIWWMTKPAPDASG